MLWGFDTSVLVPALLRRHPAHGRCVRRWQQADAEGHPVAVSAHALAETFSVLCRLPLDPPMTPGDARTLVEREIAARCRVLPVDAAAQSMAMDLCVAAGRGGGLVHDALHVACARRAGVDLLWTLNPRDFRLLWSPEHIGEP